MALDLGRIGNAVVGAGLPLLGRALLGPAGGAIADIVVGALGLEPGARTEDVVARLGQDPESVIRLREIELEHQRLLQQMVLENETGRMQAVNATMRAEAASGSRLQRWWRPAVGFGLAVELPVLIGAIVVLVFTDPDSLSKLAAVLPVISTIVGIQGAIVGVTAWRRSDEKLATMGTRPTRGLIGAIADRVRGPSPLQENTR